MSMLTHIPDIILESIVSVFLSARNNDEVFHDIFHNVKQDEKCQAFK